MEKYNIDNGYGTKIADVKRGHSVESVAPDTDMQSWVKKYKDAEEYEDIGFGRDTGDAR